MEQEIRTVDGLVDALREARRVAAGESDMLRRVRRIAERAVTGRAGWLQASMCRPDPVQGFGIHVLHEEDNHDLAVLVANKDPENAHTVALNYHGLTPAAAVPAVSTYTNGADGVDTGARPGRLVRGSR